MALTENGIKLLDIGVKGILGAVIAGIVTFYGATLQDQRAKAQEDTRRLQAAIDLNSRQKEFDIDLGMRLFGTLMNYYFQKDKSAPSAEGVRQQMLLLRLVALNFNDVPIHLKPLFEDLDNQLTTPKDKEKLRAIAQEVAGRQAYRLTINGGYDSGPKHLIEGGELPIPELLTTVKIQNLTADGLDATIYSKIHGTRSVGPFTVGYFDTPLADNTKLGEYRFALILLECSAGSAKVRFVAFPSNLAGDRFDIKELAQAFRARD